MCATHLEQQTNTYIYISGGVDVRGVWLRIFYMHWRRRRTIGGKNATDVMENDHKVVQE